jgi:DcuC family C4-dicarboxylate transporter
MLLLVAVAVVAAAAYLTARGHDVRLVLFAAALLLGSAAGHPEVVVREFLNTFSSEKFVIPICSAMGFAYVLKHTGCDEHLVRLLVAPVRRVRVLMVPGVILVGFVVNVPVISQTSTAVCLGAVVVPVMRAAGFSAATIGAALLLGASVGGELFNPGAPELNTVSKLTGTPPAELARVHLPWVVLPMLAISTAAFWVWSGWWERTSVPFPSSVGAPLVGARQGGHPQGVPLQEAADRGPGGEGVSLLKALVPLVPLALLFVTGPPFELVTVPPEWLAVKTPEMPFPEKVVGGRMIGLAMLVGVGVAALAAPRRAGGCAKAFFEGAGYGFTHIISLIVVANCFGKGIELVGLADLLGRLIAAEPRLLTPLAVLLPWLFAAICGSGMASTQSLYGFFHAPAEGLGENPNGVGALVSVGSAAGRTMSPVAAVALMCGKLTDTSPWRLAGRVAGPLLVGLAGVIVLRMLRVV